MSDQNNPFGLNQMDLTSVFIDGPNLYGTFKTIDPEYNIDYLKLKKMFSDNTRLQGISYYTSLRPSVDGQTDPVVRLTDFLGLNGFRVQTKDARVISSEFGTRYKGSMHTELIIDSIRAADAGMSHVVLFASDGDLSALVPELQSKGSRVTIVSSRESHIISEDLLWTADNFVDLKDVHLALRDLRYQNRKGL